MSNQPSRVYIRPRYSIIIPVRNGYEYLPYNLKPLIESKRQDFEVVILFNDFATVNHKLSEYLEGDTRFKVHHNENELQMSRNYEKALQLATGEWVLLLGADDSILEWFFDCADLLISRYPDEKIIRWKRSHYFWPNARKIYHNRVFDFIAEPKIAIRSTKKSFYRSLIGIKSMFELPQIYTCGLINSSLIEEIRRDGNGSVYKSIIPDIYSSIILMQKMKTFISIEIPLTIVGTSSSSMNLDFRIYNERFSPKADYEEIVLHNTIAKELHAAQIQSLYLAECLRQSPYAAGKILTTVVCHRVGFDLMKLRLTNSYPFEKFLSATGYKLSDLILSPFAIAIIFVIDFLAKTYNIISYWTMSRRRDSKRLIFQEYSDSNDFKDINAVVKYIGIRFTAKIKFWLVTF